MAQNSPVKKKKILPERTKDVTSGNVGLSPSPGVVRYVERQLRSAVQ